MIQTISFTFLQATLVPSLTPTIIQSTPAACVGTIYESCDHGAPRGRVRQTERRPVPALKGYSGPALHCNWSLSGPVTGIMTSSPLRGEEEREKEKQFALIRQCPSQITARPITSEDQ